MRLNVIAQSVLLLALLALSLVLLRHGWQRAAAPASTDTATASTDSARTAATAPSAASTPPPTAPTAADSASPAPPPPHWQAWFDFFNAQDSPAAMRSAIAQLRAALQSLPPAEASETILDLLDSAANLATGLGFQTGPPPFLRGSPTLRGVLLDLLFFLNPDAAADIARTALPTRSTALPPEEHTLHLRALAANPLPSDQPIVDAALLATLSHAPWLQNPQAATLEAFDVAVFLQSDRFAAPLALLHAPNTHHATRHAANMALDRLVSRAPAAALHALLANPQAFAALNATPDARASLFARLDPVAARPLVEQYLLHSTISPAEVRSFFDRLPNLNATFTYGLLSQNPQPLAAQHQAAIANAKAFLADSLQNPQFADFYPTIAQALADLHEWVP